MKNTPALKPENLPKHAGGRPTVITPEVVIKLEQVFAIDGTVEEACSYAEISRQTYYEYLKKTPGFADRVEELRQKPILKARQTIVSSLSDPNQAFRYMEKKRRKEFGNALDITTGGEKVGSAGYSAEVLQIAEEELKRRKLND